MKFLEVVSKDWLHPLLLLAVHFWFFVTGLRIYIFQRMIIYLLNSRLNSMYRAFKFILT